MIEASELDLGFKSRQPGKVPFPFILDELEPLRPTVRHAFGFAYIYVGDKLVCGLRENLKQPATNGMWLFTSLANLDALHREFDDLPRRCLWRSKKEGWIILASRLPNFEELAFRACELILNRDTRVGKVTRGTAGRF